ncbi:hypothetical protein BDR26DRAFT_876204, partial [Obelidium mucronatum]
MPRVSSLASVPKAANPHFFIQKVIHSDGSSFSMRVTTPKALLKLTKDTRNHILWNPSSNTIDEKSVDLAKFASRFGDLSTFDDLAMDESAVAAPKKKVVAAAAPPPAAAGGKKKK